MNTTTRKPITPDMKVGELLEQYPELEEKIISLAPPFKKLRNPILRKTVARVTSLRQAASVGGISVGRLVNELRTEAGQDELSDLNGEAPATQPQPDWFDAARIVKSIDARPIIEAGNQPLGKVMPALDDLQGDQILELIAPFVPQPIIDMAEGKGLKDWSKQEGPEDVRTYFTRAD